MPTYKSPDCLGLKRRGRKSSLNGLVHDQASRMVRTREIAFVKSQTRFAARPHCDHSWRTTVLDIDARGQCLLSFATLVRSCANESLGLGASPAFQPTRACFMAIAMRLRSMRPVNGSPLARPRAALG